VIRTRTAGIVGAMIPSRLCCPGSGQDDPATPDVRHRLRP